ncbi:pectate lyase [uncultured Cyclobacterium sp.]|uniref:pectate lyase n=1 Tax=uncultured Cyclobacterium sp. TaxID=453820 RepID=UPI0030EC4883|tara:strand:- start:109636 stop:110760 length:1125 start_codon:yes stop_codon:yes gene_type:complete
MKNTTAVSKIMGWIWAMAILAISPVMAQNDSKEFQDMRWKAVAVKMPDAWYASNEAKHVAENVLLTQKAIGGWEKNKPYHHPMDAGEKAKYLKTREDIGATFDNDATITELRFLANIYSQSRDQRYKQAFEKGINYILKAQYNNGGWPQFYPVRKGSVAYSGHITFNDDAMVNIMRFLKEMLSNDPAFQSIQLTDNKKGKIQEAYDKGIACFLNTQIVVKGEPTAWCAQHDSVSLAPAKARSYELPSFSGSESVGIVLMLMEIENPSDKVKASINDAVKWFEDHHVGRLRVDTQTMPDGSKDRIVVEDETAPLHWGRFYDLETEKIFFCDRDGIKKNAITEIGHERRNGYSWYTRAPKQLLEKYPEWKKRNGII